MMRNVHFASLMALTAAFAIGCGSGDSGTPPDESLVDSGVTDTSDSSTGEVGSDTGADDTGSFELDSGMPDTGKPETAPDTSIVDTGSIDTGASDTGAPDTSPAEMGTCEAGASCDPTNMCFTGKTLSAACVCTGGTAVSCDDLNPCTVDTCDPATGCAHARTADGTSCGVGKTCVAGACSATCTVGAPCDDGNACTTGEKFDAACACTGGTAITCNDMNPCTADSCAPATGCVFTPSSEGVACATGKVCRAGSCIDPTLFLPTVKITLPAPNLNKGFLATGVGADVCNPINFAVNANAPLKIKTLSWHLFSPTQTGSGMTGASCGAPATALAPWRSGLGKPVYAFKMDETKYAGLTTATIFTEDIAVSGKYAGIAPWLFCTKPGDGGTSFATNLDGTVLPAATTAGGGIQSLSNYCFTTDMSGTVAAKQWTMLVWLRDQAGNSAQDELKFWVYKL